MQRVSYNPPAGLAKPRQTMTFEEAIADPNRPLSLTPREWMYAVEADLAEEAANVEGTAKRLAAAKEPSAPAGTGFEKIDLGIDQLVSGCQLVSAGILDSRMADLPPASRRAVEQIKDLLETAIAPYLADIIRLSDSVDGEDDAPEKGK